MPHTPILLATGNRDKQAEFRRLLDGLPFAQVTPAEAGLSGVPDEEGDTHEVIARDKAAQWSKAASMLAIASDGGLVIPALGAALGEPLHSPLRRPRRRQRRASGPAIGNDASLRWRRPPRFLGRGAGRCGQREGAGLMGTLRGRRIPRTNSRQSARCRSSGCSVCGAFRSSARLTASLRTLSVSP